ncbi:MAG TPA: vanadium-dependent haloperoxidase [Chitinophagaceae bacterium]|nr:vanadium-dependent haloperoxidase [Chitinophagaceae bacterium]
MNRSMFSSTTATNKIAIDSLENAMKIIFSADGDKLTLERSCAYGIEVAQRIYSWAETDGYLHANDAYNPPTGPGKWKPTPPNFAKPITPYWGNLRTIVAGSMDQAKPPAPIVYSEDTSSAFYREVKSLYDVSQHLSDEQRNIVLFWKEINPGVTAPGHWLNIIRQVLEQDNAPLDKATFTYALTGMALNDAWICCWKTRYVYNLLRPVTYIREVMKHSDWLSFIPTPPHPEYTSGFAAMAGAVCEILSVVYGNEYRVTDHTYDYAGMKPRTYYSFRSMANEAGDSKWLGGIHYRFSVEAGLQEGRAVAKNVVRLVLQKDKSDTRN